MQVFESSCGSGSQMFAERQCVRNRTVRIMLIVFGVEAVFMHFGVKGRAGQAK